MGCPVGYKKGYVVKEIGSFGFADKVASKVG